MRRSKIAQGILAAGVAVLFGCAHGGGTTGGNNPPGTPGPMATANIEGKSGSSLTGNATFEQQGKKVVIKIQVQGAPPGEHGVHVHEKGDCSSPDAKSAGGHFNPTGAHHGGPTAAAHHAGDFGNMTVKEDGTGTLELTSDSLAVPEGASSVVGKAIVVHAGADDLATDPSGKSGDRIGCGVISLGTGTSATDPTPSAAAPAAPPT